MARLTIRNIPDELYQRLKENATQHRRSMNSEVIACLEKVLLSGPVDPEAFLVRVRALREKVSQVFVTEKDLHRAKREGSL
jgi:plasmid stability protein